MPISKRGACSISVLATALLLVAACGSSKDSTSSNPAPAPTGAESPAANQRFPLFRNPAAHYSIRHPEGWARRGSGRDVTFEHEGNVIHIVVDKGTAPSPASVTEELQMLQETDLALRFREPQLVRIGSERAVKAVYTTRGRPDPETGKRVALTVDRYEFGQGGRRAIVDLASPQGVDDADAYRVISESFRWR
jgi:hypothetical protein